MNSILKQEDPLDRTVRIMPIRAPLHPAYGERMLAAQ
eukprot:gene11864-20182_t